MDEQIYHSLIVDKKPVFLTYYLPGAFLFLDYMPHVQNAAKKHSDKVHFMFVNCKKNYQFWMNKTMNLPDSELIFPYENEQDAEDAEEIGKIMFFHFQIYHIFWLHLANNCTVDISKAPFLQRMMKENKMTEEEIRAKLKTDKPPIKKEFQVIKMGTKDRSIAGIETLFEEYGLLENKFDPDYLMTNMLKKNNLLDIQ